MGNGLRRSITGLAVALLAGCASMNEDECRRADWLAKGRSDGEAGEPEGRLDAHRKACNKVGVAPDGEQWRVGWAEGVRRHCVPRVAWQRGVDNRSYQGACRDHNEAEFLRWHRAGQDVYKSRQEVASNQREIDKLEEQLKKAEKDDERKALREKLRKLDDEQGRLRRLLRNLEAGAPR